MNYLNSYLEKSKIDEESFIANFIDFENNFLRFITDIYIYDLKFHNPKLNEFLNICLIRILKNNLYSLNIFYADKFNQQFNQFFFQIEKINILNISNDFLKHFDLKNFQIVNKVKELVIRDWKSFDFSPIYRIIKWNKNSLRKFSYEGEKTTFNFNGLGVEELDLKFNRNDINIFCYANFGNYLKTFDLGFFEWENAESLITLNLEINFSFINKWEEYKSNEIYQNFTFDLKNLKNLKILLKEKEKPVNSHLNALPDNFLTLFKNQSIENLEINFDLYFEILKELKNLKTLTISENIFECFGYSPSNLLKYLVNAKTSNLRELSLNKFNNIKFYSKILFDAISEIENLNYLKITNFSRKDISFFNELFSAISRNNSIRTLIFDIDLEIDDNDWKRFAEEYLLKSDITKLVIINPYNTETIRDYLRESKYIDLIFETN